ncbi:MULTISPECIES: helix-turn-helix transcriptional regulator [Streptomyces]|uniref:Helix-turn-helix type 11 domain-containing protein n=1 Tax=Streptomyces albidoflavus TaxID=1886 RepID=A0AA37BYS7_9ACTN|nr:MULTISPECIES: HTH domain-containing protein [Streptomyces]WQG71162.1 HTH domain-containing protein [Streptomyces albidoflavus]GHI45554.1 hypothetical protein ScoT_17280 [Streptomyces albidoflavus]
MSAGRLLSVLLLLLTRGRLTARALAGELSVSVRTAYRDPARLQAAGFPVYGEPGRGGGHQPVDGYRTRLTGIGEDEGRAPLLAELPGPAADLALADEVVAARLKLLAALPEAARAQAFRTAPPSTWTRPAGTARRTRRRTCRSWPTPCSPGTPLTCATAAGASYGTYGAACVP